MLIDAVDNGSAAYWLAKSAGAIDVDFDQVDRLRTLQQLALIRGYAVLVVDLPGSARRGGELRALTPAPAGNP